MNLIEAGQTNEKTSWLLLEMLGFWARPHIFNWVNVTSVVCFSWTPVPSSKANSGSDASLPLLRDVCMHTGTYQCVCTPSHSWSENLSCSGCLTSSLLLIFLSRSSSSQTEWSRKTPVTIWFQLFAGQEVPGLKGFCHRKAADTLDKCDHWDYSKVKALWLIVCYKQLNTIPF